MQHARPRRTRPVRDRVERRRLGAPIVTVLLALGIVLGASQPAGAHAELESTSPKDGATLTTAPKQLSFTFGEDLLDDGNAITLTPAAGADERLPLADPVVAGSTISVAWPNVAPAGGFTAAFRVVSEDGHPVEGSITFTVEQATGAVASPAPGGGPTVEAVPQAQTGVPSAVASAAPSPSDTPGGASPESQPEAGVLAWVLGIGVVALIGALAATWVTRRTKRP